MLSVTSGDHAWWNKTTFNEIQFLPTINLG